MAMIRALLDGNKPAEEMAELAKGVLRKKLSELEQALTGHVSDHHRFMIGRSLDHIAYLTGSINELDAQIDACIEPYRQQRELLEQIPGVKKKAAESIIAEIGVDMSCFPTHGHLASWAGMSPGNNESAGKRRSGKTTHGNRWLRSILMESAWAAARTKGSYFKSRYQRLAARRGKKRASVAVGHSILVAAYYVLKDRCDYRELGESYFELLNKEGIRNRLVKRLEDMGLKVTLEPVAQAA